MRIRVVRVTADEGITHHAALSLAALYRRPVARRRLGVGAVAKGGRRTRVSPRKPPHHDPANGPVLRGTAFADAWSAGGGSRSSPWPSVSQSSGGAVRLEARDRRGTQGGRAV